LSLGFYSLAVASWFLPIGKTLCFTFLILGKNQEFKRKTFRLMSKGFIYKALSQGVSTKKQSPKAFIVKPNLKGHNLFEAKLYLTTY